MPAQLATENPVISEAPKSKPPVEQQKPQASEQAMQVAKAIGQEIARPIPNPDQALSEIARSSLGVDMSPENRSRAEQLRNKDVVGKDKYGEGLVNKNHKGKNTTLEHEQAQALAYKDLQQKIDAGLVDPSLIGTEVCTKLGVSPEIQSLPQSYEEIPQKVNEEIRLFLEKGDLTQGEFETATREIAEFSNLYAKAYGKENLAGAFELARDNARKLVYQHLVDKEVFSGSDHGFRHIVDGNIRFAKQMIASLREKGVVVSAKDEVIIHQVMIDHDLGYTTGAAQAPKGFEASKDHPLVSAKFIEANKNYYVDRFGEDGYSAIQDSILNHSYPKLEYQSDGQEVAHAGLIRGITSTVDSLGVTVETKTPEFFWNKDAMRTLLKIRLAMETSSDGKVNPLLMDQYKKELSGLASQETNVDRRAGYNNAIGNFFNEFTADNTLGHFTGVVRKVQVEEVPVEEATGDHHDQDSHGHEGEDKKFRVVVEMTPTEVYALLGNMFGDKLAVQSFIKAAKDLGLDAGKLESHARGVRSARAKGETKESFEISSGNARVVVGNQFLEDQSQDQQGDIRDAQKIQTIAEVFHEVELLSLRTEINELLDQVREGSGRVDMIRAKFIAGISEKTTAAEVQELSDLTLNLSDTSPTGEKDSRGQDITVSEKAKGQLKGYQTARERAFLGV